MAQSVTSSVAIIGGGPAGLGLALALHAQGIQCSVYEAAPEKGRFSGAVVLSPNSLSILDTLGVYDKIRTIGANISHGPVQNDKGETIDEFYLGSKELYGYDALRIYRGTLVKILASMCIERGIQVHYEKRFSRVVSEDPSTGVTIEFADNTTAVASLLIAADGIHSRVRKHIFPTIEPIYNNILVVAGTVESKHFSASTLATNPCMYLCKPGMFLLAPQDYAQTEWLAGTQKPYSDVGREGFDRIAKDKTYLRDFLRQGWEDWPEIVQQAIEGIGDDTWYIWPHHIVPKLPRWTSETGRIIIVGDAAHAFPPSAGQGANQAFEDVITLATLLAKHETAGKSFDETMRFWQRMRQERVDVLLDVIKKIDNLRLPTQMREKLNKEEVFHVEQDQSGGPGEYYTWLFRPDWQAQIEGWLQGREVQSQIPKI